MGKIAENYVGSDADCDADDMNIKIFSQLFKQLRNICVNREIMNEKFAQWEATVVSHTHTRTWVPQNECDPHSLAATAPCSIDSHVVASIQRVHCGLHVWRAFHSLIVDRIGLRRRLAALCQVSPANGFTPNGRASVVHTVLFSKTLQHFWVNRKNAKLKNWKTEKRFLARAKQKAKQFRLFCGIE